MSSVMFTFRDGGYASTPIDSMLPVLHYGDYEDSETRYSETFFSANPTTAGKLSGVWLLKSETNEHSLSWDEMPSLYGLNRFPLIRVAATVLSEKVGDGSGDDSEPLFAFQRYGEGMTAILSTGETWQWQMQLPKENEQHERLWRQITRYLSKQVLGPVQRHVSQDNLTRWTPTKFAYTIRDSSYEKQENLQATLEIESPSGKQMRLALDESLDDIGLYQADFLPEETGVYQVHLSAMDEHAVVVGESDDRIVVEEDHREFKQAQFDEAFLQSLASHSGGAYLSLNDLETLPQKIPIPVHDNTQEFLLHLWHLPVFYILLVLVLVSEWYLRRKRGYA